MENFKLVKRERHLIGSLGDIKPFKIELEGFSKQKNKYGNYLFLNVVQGTDVIKTV
ncbi:hypothetical protein [Clostridium sp.]|jgi:hypothetical protein|uniref:hypothetical protein n=1 Tax=Clostridium sp. TaxID=1506 RepID=UPI0025850CB9|nr:hypothetical protein [Clostridium sp.]